MRFYAIIAVLATAWVAYAPGGSQWRKLGPGGGGALFYPTVSPHNTGTLLVGCDMTGSYISGDAGESWRMFNLRSRAAFFAFDPVNPRVMYAGARGLFQSADGGQTWNLIFPEPVKVRGIRMPDNHAGAVMVTRDGTAPQVSALGLDPADPNLSCPGGTAFRPCAIASGRLDKSGDISHLAASTSCGHAKINWIGQCL